jgi:hypothetical protein
MFSEYSMIVFHIFPTFSSIFPRIFPGCGQLLFPETLARAEAEAEETIRRRHSLESARPNHLPAPRLQSSHPVGYRPPRVTNLATQMQV